MIKNKILSALLVVLLALGTVSVNAATINRTSYTDVQQAAAPASGSTTTFTRPSGPALVNGIVALTPATTIATATVEYSGTPKEGDEFSISTTNRINALTLSGGTFIGAPTALAANTTISFVYVASSSHWRPKTAMPGQVGLDNLFATQVSNGAPIIPQCTGTNDQTPLKAAETLASSTSRRSSILLQDNCQLQNRWQIANNAFVSLFSFTGGNMDATTGEFYSGVE